MQGAIPLYSVQQVRAIDRAAAAALGVSSAGLMERAGAAAFTLLQRRWPAARRLLVACGRGNNGGDGWVLARLARDAGLQVEVVVPQAGDPGTEEARAARAAWQQCGGGARVFDGTLPQADLIVDALLGIGLDTAPRAPLAGLLRALDAHPAEVLALDVPSGLDADSGHAHGAVLRATGTVSFIVHKRGLHTGAARDHAGETSLATLDVPPAVLDAHAPDALLLLPQALGGMLGPRARGAHKGNHGHVLVVGGDHGMGGAVRLAGEAALRSGAGLVSVATRAAHVAGLLAARPELMAHALGDAAQAGTALERPLTRASVLAVGPGLGREQWGRVLLDRCIASRLPMVLDADALNLLAEDIATGGVPRRLSTDACPVLTPHPGEAARLLACDTRQVQCDRFGSAATLAQAFDAVAVLKGAGTIVAAPGRTPVVIGAGNPGLASGGTGDVLTGVIAALRAQGLAAFEAASCGALLHAAAGDVAARAGERGLLAGDVIAALRRLANPAAHAEGGDAS